MAYGRVHVNLFETFRAEGMPRTPFRSLVGRNAHTLFLLATSRPQSLKRFDAVRGWGLQVGRLRQSARLRVWYP